MLSGTICITIHDVPTELNEANLSILKFSTSKLKMAECFVILKAICMLKQQ